MSLSLNRSIPGLSWVVESAGTEYCLPASLAAARADRCLCAAAVLLAQPEATPESRDNVNDIFEKATNVLEKESINHNDKLGITLCTILLRVLDPGDALPPEACHVVGNSEDLLGSQVVLPGGHDAIPHCFGLVC